MIFWLISGGFTILAVALLARPLFKAPAETASPVDYDLTIYRDQLAEVDRDLSRGVLSEDEADAARLEIERRILKADEMRAAVSGKSGGGATKAVATVMAVALPGLALGLYLYLGAPGVPSQPFAERPAAAPSATGSLNDLVLQLRNRLAENPEDQESWLLLGRALAEQQRIEEATQAFRHAVALAPEDLNAKAWLAEALVASAGGTVVPEARQIFAEMLEADAGNPLARFYGAMAMVQDGLLQEGLAVWNGLLQDLPPESPWAPMIRQQIAHASVGVGETPDEASEATAQANSAPRGPSQEDVAAAQEMSAEDRNAFIRSMVEGLAARLEENPDDPEGWLRLARSYQVLGEVDAAKQAIAKGQMAASKLPADSAERTAIEQALKDLEAGG